MSGSWFLVIKWPRELPLHLTHSSLSPCGDFKLLVLPYCLGRGAGGGGRVSLEPTDKRLVQSLHGLIPLLCSLPRLGPHRSSGTAGEGVRSPPSTPTNNNQANNDSFTDPSQLPRREGLSLFLFCRGGN